MALGYALEEASFISLDDLNNISVSLRVTHKSKTLFQTSIRCLNLDPFHPNLDVNVYF